MNAEQLIDQLEQDIHKLKVEYERYFSGGTPIPPEKFRDQIERQLKILRNKRLGTAIARFRLSGLEARFNSFTEMFNRRVRNVEMGTERIAGSGPTTPVYNAQEGVVVNREMSSDVVTALYKELYGSSGKVPKTDLTTFRSYLSDQYERIRGKTGCRSVQFRVSATDGKLKLKAKPLGSD